MALGDSLYLIYRIFILVTLSIMLFFIVHNTTFSLEIEYGPAVKSVNAEGVANRATLQVINVTNKNPTSTQQFFYQHDVFYCFYDSEGEVIIDTYNRPGVPWIWIATLVPTNQPKYTGGDPILIDPGETREMHIKTSISPNLEEISKLDNILLFYGKKRYNEKCSPENADAIIDIVH